MVGGQWSEGEGGEGTTKAIRREEGKGLAGDWGRTLCVGGKNGEGERWIGLPTKAALGVNSCVEGVPRNGARQFFGPQRDFLRQEFGSEESKKLGLGSAAVMGDPFCALLRQTSPLPRAGRVA